MSDFIRKVGGYVLHNKNITVGIVPITSSGNNRITTGRADYMLPIAEDYTLVENAIMSQAVMGVDSIWVVAEPGIGNWLRTTIGENIIDPLSLDVLEKELEYENENFDEANHQIGWWMDSIRVIPIYFLKLYRSDRLHGLDGSDLWAVLYGAYAINNIYRSYSSILEPSRFFVSFPYGVFPSLRYLDDDLTLGIMRDRMRRGYSRKILSDGKKRADCNAKPNRQFMFACDGKTALDGLNLPFTFDKKIWEKMRKFTYGQNKVCYSGTGKGAKLLTIHDFLQQEGDSYDDAYLEEVPNHHDIETFEDYMEYMAFRKKYVDRDDYLSYIDKRPNFHDKDIRLGRKDWGPTYKTLKARDWKNFFDEGNLI
jgi:hypothetical protein